MENKNISFTGYYGAKNLGDDLFGLVSIFGAQKYWNKTTTKLFCSYGPISKDIDIRYALPQNQKFKGQLRLLNYIEMLKTQYLILSGGSILHSKPTLLSTRRFAFFLSKLNFLKIGAIGVSLGPFKSNNDYNYIKSILQNFKFLAVRDKLSYEIANKMNLPYKPILAADLAFMLPVIKDITFSNNTRNENKIIGISLCHYERFTKKNINNEKRRENLIYTVLNEIKKDKNIKFRFFIINGSSKVGDLEITESMIKNLTLEPNQYELIPYSANTLEIFDLISSCDIMYSTRLHGAIFAAAGNTPSLLIEYHRKCSNYLDDIQIEKKWRVGDMELNPDDIVIKIKELLKNEQNNFYPRRKEMIELSRKNFTNEMVLKEML